MSVNLQKIEYFFENRRVLGPISLKSQAKKIGVIGRNGSGKSTLGRIIAGLIEPTEGIAEIFDTRIFAKRKEALDLVGVIFQNPDHQIIFPTCIEEIIFGLRQQGLSKQDAREKAISTLAEFGKTNWQDRQTHHLSQGQRHLLCLISVLAMSPKMLILDEPFAGLDLPTANYLYQTLLGLDQTLLLITHDFDVLAEFDEVIWIENGIVEMQGAPLEVTNAYRDRFKGLDFADT